jgi:hypothetical protein
MDPAFALCWLRPFSHPENAMSASKPKSPPPQQEDPLDEALEETFPASDPISIDPSPDPTPASPKHEDEAKKGHDTHHRHGKH